MRLTATIALLMAASALADDAELFLDRGETYVRAGSEQGLTRGTSVTVVAKGGKKIGTGTVMEVWPSLARVNLDQAASNDKTAAKYVSLGEKPAAAPSPPPAAPTGAVAAPPPPPPPAAEARKPAAGNALHGRATYGGAGPWTALQVFNNGSVDWHDCTVTMLPMNASYSLKGLRANDHELIGRSNFSNNEFSGDPTSARVTCREGVGDFPIY